MLGERNADRRWNGAEVLAGGTVAAHGIAVGATAASDAAWALKKLYQLNITSTAAGDAGNTSSAPKSNGETSATKRGRDAHDDYNPGSKYTVDRRQNRLKDGTIPDAIHIKGNRGIVRELKPNNARKIREGKRQVKEYLKKLKKQYPHVKWNWAVDTYTENANGTFNYQFGGLNK